MIRLAGPAVDTIVAAAGAADGWAQVIAYQPRPEIWALVIGTGAAYLHAMRNERRHDGAGDTSTRASQTRTFVAGLLVVWLALDWPIDDLSDGSLLSMHMVQYLLLSVIAPGLLLRGCPPWLVARLVRGPRRHRLTLLLRNPWFAWGVVSIVLLTSHAPVVVELYLSNDLVHLVMHAAWLTSGIVLWWPILSPAPHLPALVPPAQIAYLFLQSLVAIIPAAFLTFSATPLYAAYARLPKPAAIDAVEDQQIAGVLMKIGGGLLLWTAMAVIFFRWAGEEEAAMRPKAAKPVPALTGEHPRR